MNKKFIVTKDPDVATQLAATFKQVNNSNGTWVFLNETPTSFNFEECNNKIAFTNILCL